MLQAICRELLMRKDEVFNQNIETVYFGGGTPSLLSIKELDAIFSVIFKHYNVLPNAEITLEANPDDLSSAKLNELEHSPVNRLSIGIQSFFEDDLKFMNRAHTATEAKKCLNESLQLFDNITIDLIYGVPGMDTEKWLKNLQTAFEFNVPHISSYALTVEEKTALHNFIKKGKISPVDENLALQHFNILVEATEKEGFVQYEISNFGKPGYFSRHNSSYWKGETYVGIGPSAHSFNKKERSWNIANNIKYMQALQQNKLPSEVENLSLNNRFNEYVMTGLRTIWGVSLNFVETEFGLAYKQQLLQAAQQYVNTNLLEIHENVLRTTKKGKFLADGIASELFII